jgi:hypothetical protein
MVVIGRYKKVAGKIKYGMVMIAQNEGVVKKYIYFGTNIKAISRYISIYILAQILKL